MAIRVMCYLVGQHGWIFRGPLGPVPLQILPDGDPESRLRDTRSHHLVHFHRPHARTLGKGAPDVCVHSVAERVRQSFTKRPRRAGYPWPEQMSRKMYRNVEKRGVHTARNGPSPAPCVAKPEMSTADRLGSRESSSRAGPPQGSAFRVF